MEFHTQHIIVTVLAFLVNLAFGGLCSYLIVTKLARSTDVPVLGWIAFWCNLNAMAIMLELTIGYMGYFSYHNAGIVTESMINIGAIYFILNLRKR